MVRYQSTHNERDRETGYDFRNARSSVGDVVRFGSVDPLEGASPGFNSYAYVGGNPVRLIDPNGTYAIYVDGMKVSDEGSSNYWENQMEIYEAEQNGGDDPTKLFGEQVDMTPAPGKTNAAGVPRNGPWFWRQLLKLHPEMFSADNAARIRKGSAPIVDAKWIQYNPTHTEYMGDKLIHHHINQGNMATGIPEAAHKKFSSDLHTNRGGRPTIQKGFNLTLKTAAKATIVIGAANSVNNIVISDNKPKTATIEIGGWAGAYAGSEVGMMIGAPLGPAGIFVGGVLGGTLGYWYGSNNAGIIYDTVTGE